MSSRCKMAKRLDFPKALYVRGHDLCCSWTVFITVAPGPSLQPTDHVFVMSRRSQFRKKDQKYLHLKEVIRSHMC